MTLLSDGYAALRSGSLYKAWAKANPGEAGKLNTFVQAVLGGGAPASPVLATATGRGLVAWASMAVAA